MTLLEHLQDIRKELKKTALNSKGALTVEEAAEFTGYSVPTIYDLIHKKKIPHSKPSGKPFFSRSELERWMLSNPVKTKMDLETEAANYLIKNKRK